MGTEARVRRVACPPSPGVAALAVLCTFATGCGFGEMALAILAFVGGVLVTLFASAICLLTDVPSRRWGVSSILAGVVFGGLGAIWALADHGKVIVFSAGMMLVGAVDALLGWLNVRAARNAP